MKIGKEVKIGLGVIGVLLSVFAAVAYQKITDDTPPPRAVVEDRGGEAEEPSTVLEAGQQSEPPSNLNKKGRLAAMLGGGKTTPTDEPFAGRKREPLPENKPERKPLPERKLEAEPFGNRTATTHEHHDHHQAVDRYSDPSAFSSNTSEPPKRERIQLDPPAAVAADPKEDEPRRLPLPEAEEPLPTAPVVSETPHYGRYGKSPERIPMARPAEGNRYADAPRHEHHGDGNPEHSARGNRYALPPSPLAQENTNTAAAEENLIPPLEATPTAAPLNPPHHHRHPSFAASAEPIPTHPDPQANEISPAQQIQIPPESNRSPYTSRDQYNIRSAPERAAPQDLSGYEKSGNYHNEASRHQPLPHQSPPPVAEPEPLPRHGEQYVVQPNDSYWVIAKRLYGNGGYFKALYEYNKHLYPYPDRLRVGDKLLAPEVAMLEEKYSDLCPERRHHSTRHAHQASLSRGAIPGGRTYKVQKGDTLFDIARYELGKGSRWVEIYDLNRGVLGDDFDLLPPGTELMLPAAAGRSAPRDRMTSQPPRGPLR